MSGFRAFLLRGNLIELAVAFIMGAAFNDVVTKFVTWLTDVLPGMSGNFSDEEPSGAFLNALISFVLLAAVVYFAIVVPYTKVKERYSPTPPSGDTPEVAVLKEIRDSLAKS